MSACGRCGAPLARDATFAPDGTLVCARCAATAAIAAADAKAKEPEVRLEKLAESSWLRPPLFRRHGIAVSLVAGGVGLFGAPLAIWGFFALDRGAALVPIAYAGVMATSLWAAIVALAEPRKAAPPVHGAWTPGPGAMGPGAPPAPVDVGPTAGQVVAATAGPAMVATGCGVTAIVVAALFAAFCALIAYAFWFLILRGH